VAGVTIGGLSSGLPPNLVDQLIEAERAPIKNLEVKKEKQDTKLKLVSDLETKLRAIEGTIGNLASQKGFNDIKLETGDANVVQGAVDPSLAPKGNWNVEVIELAQKAAAVTNGFPDKDKSEMGVGYFQFDTAEGRKEVYISGANSTLEGAATAINNANVGMKASVINDRRDPENPFRLMISGVNVGGDNQINYPTLYFLDGDQDIYFDQENPAKNGRVKIDGFEFEISENSVKDIIPGVTLDLKQASPGRTVNVTVKENREAVNTKVNDFVKTMNDVLGFLQQQSAINESTDTSKTLGGDSLVRGIENRLRRMVQSPQLGVGGDIARLSQLGIEFTRNGTLKLTEDKFNATMASNPDGVRKFFAGDGFATGFVPTLKREISTLTNSAFGQVAMRKKSLQDNIRRIDDNIANKEKNLGKREEALRNKFAKLEETMSKLKQQGAAVQGMASSYQGPSFGGAQVKG
jgi:flagellar hook-associated protein 2